MSASEHSISALLISPHRQLAEEFVKSAIQAKSFQIVSDVKSYPTQQVLELRIRQWKPDVVLLDLLTDIDQACELIRFLSTQHPPVHVIGLHMSQDGDAIVRSLRVGAAEFLWAPFDAAAQHAAIARIVKMRAPEPRQEHEDGTVIGFASTKPGSGASTLAAQTAFALQRVSGKKVLLMDLDLMGGTIGFYLKLQHPHSLIDLLECEELPNRTVWSSMLAHQDGVDILPSPDEPLTLPIDPGRLHMIIQMTRKLYDYVILDLPAIFHRTSLLGFSETDIAYLVTTAELPSLHLTRKAIEMLHQLGFEKSRYNILVNRLNEHEGIGGGDLEKMFDASIKATLPNDYFSLHRVVTRGEPLGGDGDLGKAIEGLAGKLAGVVVIEKAKPRGIFGAKPVMSQI